MKATLLLLAVIPVFAFYAMSQEKKDVAIIVAKAEPTPQKSTTDSPSTSVVKTREEELMQRIETLEQHVSELSGELKKHADDNSATQATTNKVLSAFQQSAQFGGQIFANYSYTSQGIEGKDYNRFDVERMYLTAKAQIFEQGKVQLTTDVFRNTASGSYYSGLAIRVKFAFFDYAPVNGLSFKLGMIPTIGGFADGYWKYRGIASTSTDRFSFLATADIGLSVGYTLPEKLGEVTGFILNGSGYSSPEANRFKDVAFRANVTPFPEDPALKTLAIAGYVYKGANTSKNAFALKRDRIGAVISYSYSVASVGVEYNIRKDAPTNPDTVLSGNAISFFGELKSPIEELKKLSFVWRWDVFEPNVDKGNDSQRFGILGLVYKVHDRLTFAVDRQWMKTESATMVRTDGIKIAYDNRWFLHTIVNF
jgi:hypothetical protein